MLTHLKRNAVAYSALFLALGGTSYAAARLPAESVGTKELRPAAVTRAKLHRDAVTSLSVKDRSLKKIDFAPGQLTAGPKGDKGDPGAKGDQGPKGDPGAKGDPGPTLGVAGVDSGTPSSTPTAGAVTVATKSVTLTSRSRIFAIASARVTISGCSSLSCSARVGLRVDGDAMPLSTRSLLIGTGDGIDVLSPFGVTPPLDPGTHTIELVREPTTGTLTAAGYGTQHIAAIALGEA
ncbi:MAG TPA: collagen-like protein [Solirubrobacteraceae bacterium]|nr:collagen-like protein [Solirubrobacteraceae bacterium]